MNTNRTIAPELTPMSDLKLLVPTVNTLENGIEFTSFNGCSEEVIQLDFVFPFGAKYQSRPLLSSFAAEMLLEGSNGRTGVEIIEELDGYGAYVECQADYDHIELSVFCTNKHILSVLSILKDVLTKPDFTQVSFDIYRSNKKRAFVEQSEKVSVLARRSFYKQLFKDHAYGKLATTEDFDSILLQDCKTYYQNYLKDCPFKVYASGSISNELRSDIESFLTQFETSNKTSIENFETLPKESKYDVMHIEKSGVQTGLRMGNISISREHEDFPSLQVLMVCLGGYFGSRLMRNIREDKGYTYGIGAGVVSFQEGAVMYIATETGNQYVEEVIKEIKSEISRLHCDFIPEDELDVVKNYMLGSLARSADGAFSMMDRYKSVINSGLDLSYYRRYINTVNSVTSERLQDLAKQYIRPEEMLIVTSGQKQLD